MKVKNQIDSNSSSGQRRYSAPALDKGLDILELLASERQQLTQLQVAERLGRTSGEIYRMLMCLAERGYVVRETQSGGFRLTLKLYELGNKQNPTAMLRHAARLPMESLAEETGHASHLSVQYGRSIIVLMERMPPRHVCIAVGEGTVLPLIQTGSGNVLLSRLNSEAASEFLSADPLYVDMAKSQKKAFLNTLDDYRGKEEIVSESRLNKGVTDIMVPVGIEGTDTYAVLVLSHLPGADTNMLRTAIRRCASQINRNLGMV
jgi:DNA-binding IclR family transcriptional regulator